jgi:predicted alpha/beta hydrolase family esterase
MKRKTQIIIIHGGMTFKNRRDYLNFLKTREVSMGKWSRWSDGYLEKKLGKNFEITRPRMPLQDDAKYEEWKIHFERYIPHFRSGAILIGNSLGGIFLAQYLSENKISKKLNGVFLVCPPFDGSLSNEDLVGGFKLKKELSLLQESTKNLYLLFSKNDDVVPVAHADKYRKKLPNANILIYKNKNGHFRVKEFPEIIELIKKL